MLLLLLSRFSCVRLCDSIDGSPPGSPVPGILQARTLEWVAISFSSAWKWKVKVKSLSRVRLFATPWTAAYQAPPSMGFSRQEYWSGVPSPSPRHDSLNPLLELGGMNTCAELSSGGNTLTLSLSCFSLCCLPLARTVYTDFSETRRMVMRPSLPQRGPRAVYSPTHLLPPGNSGSITL